MLSTTPEIKYPALALSTATHLPQVVVPGREDGCEGSRFLSLVDTQDHRCVQGALRWVSLNVILSKQDVIFQCLANYIFWQI